ncbi:MarR family transcriptional regulator [Candidatus Pacearchaeota archaeon]|nr:MarR family transcriptional regulator [Candidatus Pacearchaeota archaeon]
MKNKNVGFLILGIAVLIIFVIIIFNQGMTAIVNDSCAHGDSCTMYKTIKTQTYLSLVITGIVFLIGLFFIFSKENERIVIKRIKPLASLEPKKFNKTSLENLNEEEKKILNTLLENKGSIFQSELIEKTGFNKVKITRILDSLEAQELIERKRRGMTNIVILKNN